MGSATLQITMSFVNCNSNDAGSFQKTARGDSTSIFIRGFDKSLEENMVILFYFIIVIFNLAFVLS